MRLRQAFQASSCLSRIPWRPVRPRLWKRRKRGVCFAGAGDIRLDDPFWGPKFRVWDEDTVTDVLDKFSGLHTGDPGANDAFANFDKVASGHRGTKDHFGEPWFDGLVYETVRGAADYLVLFPAWMGRLCSGFCLCVRCMYYGRACCQGYVAGYGDCRCRKRERLWEIHVCRFRPLGQYGRTQDVHYRRCRCRA